MVKSTVFNFNLTLKVSIQLALMMGAGGGVDHGSWTSNPSTDL